MLQLPTRKNTSVTRALSEFTLPVGFQIADAAVADPVDWKLVDGYKERQCYKMHFNGLKFAMADA
ncbi:hypothetical protein G3N59_34795 [Paraburkholderia sp. Ac-20340]|uniref:hypothetical protein n=1 Tax=Paraburkholderia sp. Ac-20340 TaxID=2703888 RepID=UPI0019816AB9|nr:hypothetical protein [Paraburkholderia sp. Ac-20340]MBN3858570.1 hypothetical protein [Paraburkholderia sp. Ac-20340]